MKLEESQQQSDYTFVTFLDQAIDRSNKSLSQIVTDLKRKGCSVNRSTLSRWRNGRSHPSWKNLAALQHLPTILNMSSADRNIYNRLLNQIIGYQSPTNQS